jgi:hypothetical protein
MRNVEVRYSSDGANPEMTFTLKVTMKEGFIRFAYRLEKKKSTNKIKKTVIFNSVVMILQESLVLGFSFGIFFRRDVDVLIYCLSWDLNPNSIYLT